MTKEEYIAEAELQLEGSDIVGVARPEEVQIFSEDGEEVGAYVKCWIWISNAPPEESE